MPPGWPVEVLPPGVEGWEDSATAYLLDGGPPVWRPSWRRPAIPVVLARLAAEHASAQVAAARAAWRDRPELTGDLPVDAATEVQALPECKGPRLAARARAVELVGEALCGRRWAPRPYQGVRLASSR